MESKVKLSPKPCSLCGSAGTIFFFKMNDIPTSCNRLWSNRKEAVNCLRGNLHLSFCPSCSYVENIALEPSKNQYGGLYDNSLYYSALFQENAERFVKTLFDKYDLMGKTVLEVSVGKVDFLPIFSKIGQTTGVKLNTVFVNRDSINNECSCEVTNNSFGDQKIDFLFSFHELEHVNWPKYFVNVLTKKMWNNPDAIFFFTVPNAFKSFIQGNCLDMIYEHVSYFSTSSLLFLFKSSGFKILDLEEIPDFSGSLKIAAVLNKHSELENVELPKFDSIALKKSVLSFAEKSLSHIAEIRQKINRLLDQGKKIVVWGAGARGVTFLNLVKEDRILYVVDINPKKQGMYIPGTGQKIVHPEFLREYKPEIVVVINPFYIDEIKDMVKELAIQPQFINF